MRPSSGLCGCDQATTATPAASLASSSQGCAVGPISQTWVWVWCDGHRTSVAFVPNVRNPNLIMRKHLLGPRLVSHKGRRDMTAGSPSSEVKLFQCYSSEHLGLSALTRVRALLVIQKAAVEPGTTKYLASSFSEGPECHGWA